ncbi:MAG: immunoglobulin-like domain-containing protein [Porticoccaceae bacterium]
MTLNDVSAAENNSLIYTASVDNAPQTPFSVTLDNGVVIHFAAGALTGSLIRNRHKDDPYVDGDSFQRQYRQHQRWQLRSPGHQRHGQPSILPTP